MQRKAILSHREVTAIMAAARQEALANQWPVTIAVVDDGGHLLALERLDGASPNSSYLAPEKARTSALGRRDSGLFEEMVNNGRTAFLSARTITALEGAVPVIHEGQVIGAVGVSGVKPGQDAQVARAGAAVIA